MIIDGFTMVGASINGYQLTAEELLASMSSIVPQFVAAESSCGYSVDRRPAASASS